MTTPSSHPMKSGPVRRTERPQKASNNAKGTSRLPRNFQSCMTIPVRELDPHVRIESYSEAKPRILRARRVGKAAGSLHPLEALKARSQELREILAAVIAWLPGRYSGARPSEFDRTLVRQLRLDQRRIAQGVRSIEKSARQAIVHDRALALPDSFWFRKITTKAW